MKELYLSIIEKFEKDQTKELYRSAGVTPIKHINLHMGQEFEEDAEAYQKPALFLKWDIDYEPTPAVATIIVKIVYENLRDTSSYSNQKDKALRFFDLINITDQVLKTVETKSTGKLNLLNESFNLEPAALDTLTITYNCNYTGKDNSHIDFNKGQFNKTPINSKIFQRIS